MEDTKQAGQTTLNDLSPGQSGMIFSVGNQSGAVKRRLVDMGLTPGTEVKVTKVAPLGDPLEVSLRGYELSLRRGDALQIVMGQPQRRISHAKGAVTRSGRDPEELR
ncbi:MAG: ferrous iron transport protein A, partial [Lawsonibacter sp.]